MANPDDPALPRCRVLLLLPARRAATTLSQALHSHGWPAEAVEDERDALEVAGTGEPTAIVLDVRRPGTDVVAFVSELQRTAPEVPLIAITPDEQGEHTVASLRGDRDDYVVTPFRVEELIARLRLRSRHQQAGPPPVARWGSVTVDAAMGLASMDGRLLSLSRTEFAMLAALARQRGRPVTRERLAAQVWGRRPSSNLVEVYVGYLRRKLGPDVIRTVRGSGYVLEA